VATAVVMPKLGLTMQEGTVTSWLVASATPVSAGVAVLAISTDKIDTELPSPASGRLVRILRKPPVNMLLAIHIPSFDLKQYGSFSGRRVLRIA